MTGAPPTLHPDDPAYRDSSDVLAPTSDLQRGWWFGELHHPNPDLVIAWPTWLSGTVQTAALRRAVDRLVARHEGLRTNLTEVDGMATQVIHSGLSEGAVWTEDLSGLAAPERDARVTFLVDRERDRRFNLQTDPLFRVGVVPVSTERTLLLLTFHHIIIDGWSVDAVYQELSQLYAQECGGQDGAAALRQQPRQLREWAEEEQRWNRSPEADAQLRYWRARLADLTPLHLPYDRPPSDPMHFVFAERHFTIPPEVARGVQAVARRARATPFIVSMTGFLMLLAARTGRSEVATMSLVNRRESPDTHELVGCLTNVLTVRATVSPDTIGPALVRQVRSSFFDAYAHQDLFVTRLWDAIDLGPGSIDALYIHDEVTDGPAHFGPHAVEPYEHPEPRRFERYGPWENLKIRVLQPGSEVTGGVIEYNAELYDAATIDACCAEYVHQLHLLAAAD